MALLSISRVQSDYFDAYANDLNNRANALSDRINQFNSNQFNNDFNIYDTDLGNLSALNALSNNLNELQSLRNGLSIYDDDPNDHPMLVSVPYVDSANPITYLPHIEYVDSFEMAMNEILMDSDPNMMHDVLSEAVRIRETKEKSQLIVRGGRIPGSFSLSFDEGPSEYTFRLLECLKKYNRKCGFYIDPFNVTEGTASAVSRMFKDGHTVGLSVCSDISLTDVSLEESRSIISKYANEYSRVIGWLPGSVRLPRQGYYSDDINYCLSNGMTVCEPSIDSADFSNPNFIPSIISSLDSFSPSTSGIIILMRDTYNYSVDKIDEVVSALTSRGYEFIDYKDNTGFKSIKKDSKNKKIGEEKGGLSELLAMEEIEQSSTERVFLEVDRNIKEAVSKKESRQESRQESKHTPRKMEILSKLSKDKLDILDRVIGTRRVGSVGQNNTANSRTGELTGELLAQLDGGSPSESKVSQASDSEQAKLDSSGSPVLLTSSGGVLVKGVCVGSILLIVCLFI